MQLYASSRRHSEVCLFVGWQPLATPKWGGVVNKILPWSLLAEPSCESSQVYTAGCVACMSRAMGSKPKMQVGCCAVRKAWDSMWPLSNLGADNTLPVVEM